MESALREARTHVADSGFAERCRVVLRNGGGVDTEEASKEVGLPKRDDFRVIGLGLGHDTDDLRKVIRRSFVGFKPAQLAVAFTRLLGRAVSALARS